MLYKRPNFKMGGSPTGIETLTPRVKAQNGFNSFLNNYILGDRFKTNKIDLGADNFPSTKINQNVGIEQIFADKKPRFQIKEPLSIEDFYKIESDRRQKKAEDIFEFMKAKPSEVDGKTYSITSGKEIDAAPKFQLPRGGGADFQEIAASVVAEPKKKIITEDPKDSPKTFEDIYQTEFNKLEKLIGGREDDKGKLAIALSDAIGTPGSLADKASQLNKSLLKIVGDRKANKRDIAKTAYLATKEIQKANIAAGKVSDSQKNLDRAEKLVGIINNPNSSKEDVAKAKAELKNFSTAVDIFSKKDQSFSSGDLRILESLEETVRNIQRHKASGNKKKLEESLGIYARLKSAVAGNSKFDNSFAIADAQISGTALKDGGRIGFQEGTPLKGGADMAQVPAAQTPKLSFEELRNRLPQEITNDIIELIANSQQALQDFSFIRTQGDVDKFNIKYGVNLVLPAQS